MRAQREAGGDPGKTLPELHLRTQSTEEAHLVPVFNILPLCSQDLHDDPIRAPTVGWFSRAGKPWVQSPGLVVSEAPWANAGRRWGLGHMIWGSLLLCGVRPLLLQSLFHQTVRLDPFLCFFIFLLLGLHLRPMEVPKQGVQSEL